MGGVGGEGPESTADVIDWFRAWPIPFATVGDAVAHLGGGPAARVWAEGLEETDAGWVPRFDVDVLEAALRHVQVPGAGHDVHLDAPERVAELVRGFEA